MGGAFLLGLEGDRGIAALQRRLDLVAALADHHHPLLGAEAVDPVEQVQQQRPPGDRVQHLVHVGAHAGALAGGEDHDSEIGRLVHRRPNGTGIPATPVGPRRREA